MKTKIQEKNTKSKSNTLKGVVVSDKMDKTIVVSVTRFVEHKKYGKRLKISKKLHQPTKLIPIIFTKSAWLTHTPKEVWSCIVLEN